MDIGERNKDDVEKNKWHNYDTEIMSDLNVYHSKKLTVLLYKIVSVQLFYTFDVRCVRSRFFLTKDRYWKITILFSHKDNISTIKCRIISYLWHSFVELFYFWSIKR